MRQEMVAVADGYLFRGLISLEMVGSVEREEVSSSFGSKTTHIAPLYKLDSKNSGMRCIGKYFHSEVFWPSLTRMSVVKLLDYKHRT